MKTMMKAKRYETINYEKKKGGKATKRQKGKRTKKYREEKITGIKNNNDKPTVQFRITMTPTSIKAVINS